MELGTGAAPAITAVRGRALGCSCSRAQVVHAVGFAPTTSCSQGRRPTGLGYAWMVEPVGLVTDISPGKGRRLYLSYGPVCEVVDPPGYAPGTLRLRVVCSSE